MAWALSLLPVPQQAVWAVLAIGLLIAALGALSWLRAASPTAPQIKFDLGKPWKRRRPWYAKKISVGPLGGAVAASAASFAGTISTADTGDLADLLASPDGHTQAIFFYLPIHNLDPNIDADSVEATLEFEDVAGKPLLGPLQARWMNSPNPVNQDPHKDASFYDRWQIPAGAEESIDLVYCVSRNRCFVYTNESARYGLIPDPNTAISEAEFRVKLAVKAPRAETLRATLRVAWSGDSLGIERVE